MASFYDVPPILIQMRDEEGFWVNIAETQTVKEARRLAGSLIMQREYQDVSLRVVKGPKREVVVQL